VKALVLLRDTELSYEDQLIDPKTISLNSVDCYMQSKNINN
jgi:hypothetical protein